MNPEIFVVMEGHEGKYEGCIDMITTNRAKAEGRFEALKRPIDLGISYGDWLTLTKHQEGNCAVQLDFYGYR